MQNCSDAASTFNSFSLGLLLHSPFIDCKFLYHIRKELGAEKCYINHMNIKLIEMHAVYLMKNSVYSTVLFSISSTCENIPHLFRHGLNIAS